MNDSDHDDLEREILRRAHGLRDPRPGMFLTSFSLGRMLLWVVGITAATIAVFAVIGVWIYYLIY